MVVHNNKPVTDALNKLNKRQKATSISSFELCTLQTNLLNDKLLMVLNRLRDVYFDGGERNSYGTRWVKDMKDNKIILTNSM